MKKPTRLEKIPEHKHRFTYSHETTEFYYYKCIVRGCLAEKYIHKKTGKETIVNE